FFPVENLQHDEIVLFEGEPDCILACQMGINGLTQTAGCSTWKPEWNPLFKDKKVIICYDTDSPGMKGANTVAENLAPIAKEVRIITLPCVAPLKDFTEWVLQCGGTTEQFRKLIEESPTIESVRETSLEEEIKAISPEMEYSEKEARFRAACAKIAKLGETAQQHYAEMLKKATGFKAKTIRAEIQAAVRRSHLRLVSADENTQDGVIDPEALKKIIKQRADWQIMSLIEANEILQHMENNSKTQVIQALARIAIEDEAQCENLLQKLEDDQGVRGSVNLILDDFQKLMRQDAGAISDISRGAEFDPVACGDYLLQAHNFHYEHGKLYVYDGGRYRDNGKSFVRQRLADLLANDFRENRYDETLFYIVTRLLSDGRELNTDRDHINVANGILNWRTGEMKPHDPKILTSIRIPIYFDSKAECPEIERFLYEVLDDEVVDLIYEIIGYLLIPDTSFEKSFMLTGPGANGKSTLLRLITKFIGAENISSETLQDLAENRFRLANLCGKLVNIAADIDGRDLTNPGIFKALVSGDRISAERKNRDPFDFQNFARLIFSANEIPGSRDQSYAFYRRWIIIPFSRTIPEQQRDTQLIQKLTTANELSGLLNKAVEGLRRLYAQGHFSEPDIVKNAVNAYQEAHDSVRGFVEECCKFGNEESILQQALYNAYRDYCAASNQFPLKKGRFAARLKQLCPQVRERHENLRLWLGISLARPGADYRAGINYGESGAEDDDYEDIF
ncbi:MAG TPA: hypothetical protein GX509_07155, partial [Firmicutes bacterium]|nr:hypothetical protein [Bacillota bacterium]